MTSSVHDTPVLSATLGRLAQACESQLGDPALARRLRALAEGWVSSSSDMKPPSVAEAIALADAFSRYGGQEETLAAVRDLVQQAGDALAARDRGKSASRVAGLYVIVDPERTRGRSVVEIARGALRGGASAIQLRDKVHDKGDQFPVACELKEACLEHGAAFIMNDHADLAVACGADGLHIGQHDLPVAEARRILYPTQFLGTSNALLEEAVTSWRMQVDYIGVGAIYETNSKSSTRPAGIHGLRRVREQVHGIPVVAIGGITLHNLSPVLEAGADGVCVISAVCQAHDPEQAARRLVERIAEHRASSGGGIHGPA